MTLWTPKRHRPALFLLLIALPVLAATWNRQSTTPNPLGKMPCGTASTLIWSLVQRPGERSQCSVAVQITTDDACKAELENDAATKSGPSTGVTRTIRFPAAKKLLVACAPAVDVATGSTCDWEIRDLACEGPLAENVVSETTAPLPAPAPTPFPLTGVGSGAISCSPGTRTEIWNLPTSARGCFVTLRWTTTNCGAKIVAALRKSSGTDTQETTLKAGDGVAPPYDPTSKWTTATLAYPVKIGLDCQPVAGAPPGSCSVEIVNQSCK